MSPTSKLITSTAPANKTLHLALEPYDYQGKTIERSDWKFTNDCRQFPFGCYWHYCSWTKCSLWRCSWRHLSWVTSVPRDKCSRSQSFLGVKFSLKLQYRVELGDLDKNRVARYRCLLQRDKFTIYGQYQGNFLLPRNSRWKYCANRPLIAKCKQVLEQLLDLWAGLYL